MKQQRKHATDLYVVVALMKCADYIKTSMVDSGQLPPKLVSDLDVIFRAFNYMMLKIKRRRTENELNIWEADWKRDYQVFSSVFEKMAEMTDEQRNALEHAADGILRNELQLIDNTKN